MRSENLSRVARMLSQSMPAIKSRITSRCFRDQATPLTHEFLASLCDFETALDVRIMGARCIGLKLPAADSSSSSPPSSVCRVELLAEELAFAASLASRAERERFMGGRLALRRAMGPELSARCPPVLRGPRGEPAIAEGILGSITHKASLAVAIALPFAHIPSHQQLLEQHLTGSEAEVVCDADTGVGIDVEDLGEPRSRARFDRMEARLLTQEEQKRLGHLVGVEELTRDHEVNHCSLRIVCCVCAHFALCCVCGRVGFW